ncbi:MAG: PIN domain-containing protein [Planctomycetes bacterium]|nr:PIN domain-containing protein [Planctomycetota bacterium]
MNRFVVDTHAMFWYLTSSPRLGQRARDAFASGVNGEAILFVPAIVLAELFFLNEKVGRPLEFSDEFRNIQQSGLFVFVPFTPQDVLDFDDHRDVSEMHDRMIVGAAHRLNASCLTRDAQIVASKIVPTVW